MNYTQHKKKVTNDLDFDYRFEIESTIRFLGICTMEGKLLDAQYKDDIKPLLTDTALQFSVIKTAIRSNTRISEDKNIGRPLYSVTSYENVKRATIPFGEDLLLLVSFEKIADETLVIEKILRYIKEMTK